MKTTQLILGLCIALTVGVMPASAQSKKEKKSEIARQVRQAIDSNHYKIDVDRMLPMSGNSKTLTSTYSLEIKNDSVFSYLPYFGKAYNIPYGGGKGLIFDDTLSEYTATYNKKGKVEIKFTVRTDEDKYTYHIQIFPNASTSISINSNNRQPINYQGELVLPQE